MQRVRTFALVALLAAACGEDPAAEIPSPDELGKGDGQEFVIKGMFGYGEVFKGRLHGAKTYHGVTFEALEGAVLAVSGTSGRAIAVYGPEDRAGAWGPLALASSTAGTLDGFTIPEDGRYVAIIGGKKGSYELRLSCRSGCDVDENAGKLLVNSASRSRLEAAGFDADDILAYRERYGVAANLDELDLAGAEDVASVALHRVFFSPRIGAAYGFAPESRARKAFVKRTSSDEVDWVPGDVAMPAVDLFRRAEREIQIAMYGMSLSTPEGQALLEAAARGVKVKVYLDVSERDPDGRPYTETVIRTLVDTPNVEVRVPRFSAKMMHEKFAIVDGLHVFDGSANISRKARDVYTEDRFFFMNSPAVVAQFAAEWDRLWNKLGKDARLILN